MVTVCHQAEKCRGLLLQHMGLAGVLLFVRYLVVWGNLAEATVAQHPLSHCRVPSIWYSREGKMKRKTFNSRNYFACTTLKLFYVCLSPPFFSPQQANLAKFTVSTRLFLQKIRNISGLPRGRDFTTILRLKGLHGLIYWYQSLDHAENSFVTC